MIFVTILLIWSDRLHIRTTLIQEITFLNFSIVCTKVNMGVGSQLWFFNNSLLYQKK